MAEQEFVKAEEIDVLEELMLHDVPSILRLLLEDKTTKKNILWATKDYEALGKGYEEWSEILPELITGEKAKLIQPRSSKAKEEQTARTRDKAEVFTPSWVCNAQNNLIDAQWFGAKNVFNVEDETGWIVNKSEIPFEETGSKTWEKYVDLKRLEVTCGEAPYLISRYDTVTGDLIPVKKWRGRQHCRPRFCGGGYEKACDSGAGFFRRNFPCKLYSAREPADCTGSAVCRARRFSGADATKMAASGRDRTAVLLARTDGIRRI